MTVNEKIAYLKGLMEGLDFEPDTPEKRILSLVVEIIGDMCEVDDSISDRMDNLEEYISEIDSDLGDVEEVLCERPPEPPFDPNEYLSSFDDIDDLEDLDDDDLDELEELDEYDDEDEDDDDEVDDTFSVECPECGEEVYFDSSLLDRKEIRCPSCNNLFKFRIDEE